MGELPIFTSKACVFTIDSKTKRTWVPSSNAAVEINFFFDPTNNSYRIVSIEDSAGGKKVIVNSSLMEKMNFKKTSQKFGQWSDSRQNTIFGLGFNSEAELDSFFDKFKDCIDSMRKRSNTVPRGDNNNLKEFQKELVTLQSNRNNEPGSDRSWLNSNPSSPILNSNFSRVNFLETELERVSNMYEDLKEQHQSDIKRMKEGLQHTDIESLANTVENYKGLKDLRTRIIELENENMELKNKVSQLTELKEHNPLYNQLSNLVNLHQQMESIISQLNSSHFDIGQKIKDIVSSEITSADVNENTLF